MSNPNGHALQYATIFDAVEDLIKPLSVCEGVPQIHPAVLAFHSSVHSLACLASLPASIALVGMDTEFSITHARIRVYKTIQWTEGESKDERMWNEINAIAAERRKIRREKNAVNDDTRRCALLLDDCCIQNQPAAAGVHALISSLVIGMWTAFEVLASDLWEESLNCHPGTLATLSGSPGRIENLAKGKPERSNKRENIDRSKPESNRDDPPSIYLQKLESITKGTFDMSKCMGSILRDKFHMTALSGIRKAYSKAFSKDNQKIDEALASHAIDALSMVRNILVHKAGVADEEYAESLNVVKCAPQVAAGLPIQLDGAMASDLLLNSLNACSKLIEGVGEWIVNHTK